MRLALVAACVLAGLTLGVRADPIGLLAPDDPAVRSGWRPPPAATAGLKSYAPVEAKDWLGGAGRPVGAAAAPGSKSRDGVNGMEGMKGMPGMGR